MSFTINLCDSNFLIYDSFETTIEKANIIGKLKDFEDSNISSDPTELNSISIMINNDISELFKEYICKLGDTKEEIVEVIFSELKTNERLYEKVSHFSKNKQEFFNRIRVSTNNKQFYNLISELWKSAQYCEINVLRVESLIVMNEYFFNQLSSKEIIEITEIKKTSKDLSRIDREAKEYSNIMRKCVDIRYRIIALRLN